MVGLRLDGRSRRIPDKAKSARAKWKRASIGSELKHAEETAMYTVYFAPPGAGDMRPLDKERWPNRCFANLSDALIWAHAAAAKGTVVVRIEGGGTALDRSEVAGCLKALALIDDRGSRRRG
jgi:hypothetical protein